MATKQPCPEEFKIEAAKQITESGNRVADVSARIGFSQHSLHKWVNPSRPSRCTPISAAMADSTGRRNTSS